MGALPASQLPTGLDRGSADIMQPGTPPNDLSNTRPIGEQALRESEERFRTIFERNSAGIVMIGPDGRFIRANDAFCVLVGRNEEQLRQMKVADLVHPDERPITAQYQEALQHGKPTPIQSERRIIRPGGEIRWLRLSGAPIMVGNRLSSHVLTATDITVERKIAQAVRASEEFFRDIADLSPVMLWLVNPSGVATFLNKAMRDFLGVTADQLTSQERLSFMHPDDQAATLDHMQAASRNQNSQHHEVRMRRSDGEYRWFLTRTMPWLGPDGQMLGYVASAFEITDRKDAEQALITAHQRLGTELRERQRIEEQLRALSERLIHAQEQERRRIARDLHDDLGQRVAALCYSLFGLKQINAENPAAMDRIRGLEEDLAALGSDIRNLSHRLHPAMLDLGGLSTVVMGLCKELKSSGVHVAPEIRLHDDDVPREVALGAFRIAQEGLQNVVKHAGVNRARLRLAVDGERLEIVISDNGAGFDPENQAVGLGLVSIRERTRLLNGVTRIISQPGEGTTIHVSLPLPVESRSTETAAD